MTPLIPQTITPLAPFAHLADGRTVTSRPTRALRRRLRTPEPLTISQWAERYRRVTEIDARPGRWRPELVPHTAAIMDDIGKPSTRQVWICLPERGAKTQILLNTVCWQIDQGAQAGNIFWLMPTEHDARKAMGERVIPVFKARDDHGRPGRIARYLTATADDTTRGTIRFNHGIRLFPAWANSPGSMAAYFGRLNIADEIDKFPIRTSEGTDPITLFLKRARDDRHRSKYVFASTPAGRFIHAGTHECDQLKTWAMRCNACGDYVTPGEEHLHIPDGTTPQNAQHAELGLSCPACGVIWDEDDRASAYRAGRQQILKGAELKRPETIGWHAPAWIFPTIPLAEIAAAKLRADDGADLTAIKAYANGYLVADHEETVIEGPAVQHLADRREPYGQIVPMDAAILTAGVDVQGDRLEVEVVAWGVGAQSWGMEYKVLWGDTSLPEVWGQLDSYLLQTWRHESGVHLPLARTFVDIGYRDHMVARFVHGRLSRGVFACKGSSTLDAPALRGPSKQKTAGVIIRQYLLGPNALKSQLFGYFGLEQPGPGYCHISGHYPDEWFAQLAAEHQIMRQVGRRALPVWEKVKPGLRNEAIDLRAAALAALLSMRVDLKGAVKALKDKTATQSRRRVISKGVQHEA